MLSLDNIIQLFNAYKAKRKKSNWAQCDNTAEDYIENRPFYKEVTTLEFTDDDYINPYYSNDDAIVYQVTDKVIDLDDCDEIFITYGLSLNDTKELKMHLVKKEQEFSETDETQLFCLTDIKSENISSNYSLIMSFSAITGSGKIPIMAMFYNDQSANDDINYKKGIYVIQNSDEPNGAGSSVFNPLIKLYGISTVKYHKIPKEYMPETEINKKEIQSMIDDSVSSVLGGAS